MAGTNLDLDALEDRGDPTAVAELAAESLRVLNRLTIATPRPGHEGWEDVGDLYRVLGEVRILVERLPQVLDQLVRHLDRDGVRYRSDAPAEHTPQELVTAAVDALDRAQRDACQVGAHLAVAQSAVSHLAPAE